VSYHHGSQVLFRDVDNIVTHSLATAKVAHLAAVPAWPQHILALANSTHIRGERAESPQRTISYYEAALTVP
jgi:hypothetical protein